MDPEDHDHFKTVGSSTLPTLRSILPSKRESSNVKQALADRLLLSEAIDAVSRMIRGYANSGAAGKSYIGAIAELLMRYPRQVALKCADPFGGVASETKFLPTPADIIGWCQREQRPLQEEASREDRIAEQLRLRDEWKNQSPDDSLKAKGQAWLDRTDPLAQQLTKMDPKTQRLRDENSARLVAEQREFVRRVWDSAGAAHTPTIGGVPITPELALKIGLQPKRRDAADVA